MSRFHFDDALRFESVLRGIPRQTPFKKVFLIGTSQAREDIDVAYLNEQFKDRNIRFYDLGVIGTFYPVDLYMLKDRLIAARPDALFYTPFVETFYTPYKIQPVNNLEYYFNPNILPYLAKHLRREDYDKDFRGDFLDVFAGSFSLFYRFRNHFDEIFYASFKYSLGVEKRPLPMDSFFTEPYPDSYFEKQIEKYKKEQRYRYTRYTDLYQDLFDVFARDVVAHDIRLIVSGCPLHPLFPKICSPQVLEGYDDFLTEQSRRIGFTFAPHAELPPFAAEEFNDFTHLTRAGRARYTRYLIDYFERELETLK